MLEYLYKALFVFVVFISNIVQAVTGFAGTVLAMPFSILLVGKDFAKPILNAIAIILCAIIAIKERKNIDWKFFLIIIIFTGIGMAGGMVLEKYFYSKLFLQIYGGIICLVAIYYFFAKDPIKLPMWCSIIIMLLAGIIHGIFVSGGPLLIIAIKSHLKDKEKFRATLSSVWVCLNSVMLTVDLIEMRFTLDMLYVFLIIIPTVILSIFIGRKLLNKLSNDLFMKITCVLLLISGITLFF